jgi:signal transduction histidine kinase
MLSSIKEFNLSAPVEIRKQATNITEFRELNESMRMMAQKVMKDYQSLKDFTDHASHEMQTPLAIINSKLDVLIQEPELSEASMLQAQSIYKAVEKLSRLCQSLLLLARIENHQYTATELISMNELLREKTKEMQEWLDAMNFKIVMQLDPLPITMNRDLAEILISNLLSNAVRHNDGYGTIAIQTAGNKLIVSNTGKTPLDKSRIFNRFYKSDYSDGSGLGLAIVQHICEQYQFKLNYDFNDGQHCFTVIFNKSEKE